MARVAIANTSTYIQGSVDYYAYVSGSNIVVDVYFQMRRTNTYSGSTYSSTAIPRICISGDSANFGYSGSAGITVAGGQQDVWQGIYNASRTFDASRGGSTIYVGWKVDNDNSGGYLGGSAVAQITLPTVNTPPTGLSANNIVIGTESFSATVSVTGWGVGTGQRYRELQCWTYNASSFVTPRRYQAQFGNDLSGTIIVDNFSDGDLTIVGNTRYTLGIYAGNGSIATGSQRVGNYATLAYAPSVSINTINDTSVVIKYSTQADGGFYAKNLQYSFDGETWITFATINSSSATTGTYTISGLQPKTAYTLKNRVSTTAGVSNGNDVTFTTVIGAKFYGPVNDKTKLINKFYGSVNGKTKEIKKLYGPALASQFLLGLDYENRFKVGNIEIVSFDPSALVNVLNGDSEFNDTLVWLGMDYNNISGLDVYQSSIGWQVFIRVEEKGQIDFLYFLSEYDSQYGGVPYTLQELGLVIDNSNAQENDEQELYLYPKAITAYETKLVFQA